MLDYEARDIAHRLIQARLVARSKEFGQSIRDIHKGIPMSRPKGAYGATIRDLCVREIEIQGSIVWEELKRVLLTLGAEGVPSPGEYRTWETLAANLKSMVAHHLGHLPTGLGQVMQEFEEHDTAILRAVQERTLGQIGTEIDLCVRSFQHCAAARATQSHASEVIRMAIFDQRGQHVSYQYNAAGDINFGAVQNRMEVVGELAKLQAELRQAIQTGLLDEEVATDADYQLTKAVQQAKKPEPDKKTILEHLSGAKALIEGVAAASGLVNALTKAAEVVQQLF